MNQTIASPSPIVSLRRTWAGLWNDPDSRSVVIGLLGMLLVHLLLFLFAPYLLRTDGGPSILRPHASPQVFNIQLAPDAFVPPPKPRPPTKFVETNPNAPDNTPDKTENFAARNQQVAQEKPTPNGKSERPAMEGQTEIHSTQIVTGQLKKQVEMTEVAPAVLLPPKPTQKAARREQNPLTGFEKKEGDNENGIGTNISNVVEGAKAIPQKIEGVKNAPLIEGASATMPAIDPLHPRPRPQVVKQMQVRPAIFEQKKAGTSNMGIIGISAQFSNYGAYLQRMIEAIQLEWDNILSESQYYPPSGTSVTIKFKMNDEGRIVSIISVDGTSGKIGEQNCMSAITNRSPYGTWTADMKAVLGESQEMTFQFYYQ